MKSPPALAVLGLALACGGRSVSSDSSGDGSEASSSTSSGDESSTTGGVGVPPDEPSLTGVADDTCAVRRSGKAYCWGWNWLGAFGLGHADVIGDDETPEAIPISGLGQQVAISGSRTNVCVLGTNGRVVCTIDDLQQEQPRAFVDFPVDDIVRLYPTEIGGCAQTTGSHVTRCWTDVRDFPHENQHLQLDVGDAPRAVYRWGGVDEEIMVCFVAANGDLQCAVDGPAYDDLVLSGDEFADFGAGGKVVQIAGADPRCDSWCENGCVLYESGSVQCWGTASSGILGNGPIGVDCVPTEPGQGECVADPSCCIGDDESPFDGAPVELGARAIQITVEPGSHACALLEGGGVRCWGGVERLLGYGEGERRVGLDVTPAEMGDVELPDVAIEIASGAGICALLDNDDVYCWGANTFLGYGNSSRCETDPSSCALGDDESPSAWGPVPLPD